MRMMWSFLEKWWGNKMALHKLPKNISQEEFQWYEKTPKHAMFAMLQDFAMRCVGIAEVEDNPKLILEELKETERILRLNKMIP